MANTHPHTPQVRVRTPQGRFTYLPLRLPFHHKGTLTIRTLGSHKPRKSNA